jgi:hypothetical protein
MHDQQQLIKVIDHNNLARDRASGAIVDTDADAYTQYMKVREARARQLQQIDSMEDRINTIDSDISEIKNLLRLMLEKQNGHSN